MNDLNTFEDFSVEQQRKKTIIGVIKTKIHDMRVSIRSFKNSISRANDILSKRCYHCKNICDSSILIEQPTSFCESTVCEIAFICPLCDGTFDYWFYGAYEREADTCQMESENPIIFKMIKLWSEGGLD